MVDYNLEEQYYKGLSLRLIKRKDYKNKNAKRFTLNRTNQNIWIPNSFLLDDGTIKKDCNLDWIFNRRLTKHKLKLAGKSLECSRYGDIRFSNSDATVEVSGVVDTILNHYHKSKVFKNITTGELVSFNTIEEVEVAQRSKEYKVSCFKVGDKRINKKYLPQWYKSLWVKYFLKNPNLLSYLQQFDTFTNQLEKSRGFDVFSGEYFDSSVMQEIRNKGIIEVKECLEDFFNQINK